MVIIVETKFLGNSLAIQLTSKVRQKIGISEGTKFKIWRSDGKIKLESVK